MDIQHSPPIDLRPYLTAIIRKGIRKADIARRIGVSRTAISDASKPSDKPWTPSYPNGVRLMQMYSDVCGEMGPHA